MRFRSLTVTVRGAVRASCSVAAVLSRTRAHAREAVVALPYGRLEGHGAWYAEADHRAKVGDIV